MRRRGFTSKKKKEDEKQSLTGLSSPDTPTIPARPKELAKAQVTLQQQLGKQAHVAPGYGFDDLSAKDRTQAWRLYVFTDDDGLLLPAECMGFQVSRRAVPAKGPWPVRR